MRITPKMKARTNLLQKLKGVFRCYKSQPIGKVIHIINPILRGWINYFRIGNANRSFCYVKHWVEKKIRRNLTKARKARKGFGWKRWNNEWIYKTLGLYSDYGIRYLNTKVSSAQYVINFGKESARKA
ncbi:group II intron maturase-specific domain-containing protein [Wolbachia endosymbiont (group B) of Philonthus cognatus]|uniref:group II intron maturase-specific domain-containing protein n=1 Tax=Wolbachia endosymbiont (group B) of Philonthus cognatus TaxID=2954047 RepID=UPI002220BBD6|nr:group II intron maturase-specific domain-containing protein [Wolbachia endosymbiont (group B) of Philonthus cognatus]